MLFGMAFENAEEFDKWWGRNGNIFESEALAIERLLPESVEDAVVIGNGTGRFAVRLGISFGIDPSSEMCQLARRKGVDAVKGRAEDLPFAEDQFSLALFIGTIAYVDNLEELLREAHRILKHEGKIIIAFIPKNRSFSNLYEKAVNKGKFPKNESPEYPYPLEFAKEASWRSVEKVFKLLHDHGFVNLKTVQTLTGSPKDANDTVEIPKTGHGEGSWVVVKGTKKALKRR